MTPSPLNRIPLLPLLPALMAGIVLSRYFPDAALPVTVLIALSCMAALTLRRRYAATLLAAILAGYLSGFVHTPRYGLPPGKAVYTGTVARVTEATMSSRAIVDIDGGPRCYLTIPNNMACPEAGDIIRFEATLEAPEGSAPIAAEVDMRPFFYRNYISAIAVPSGLEVTGRSSVLKYRLLNLRDRIVDRIISSGVDDDTAAFLTTIIAGDNSLMPDEWQASLSEAGLAHILALSGLHVAIIASILAVLFFPLGVMASKGVQYAAIIILLWIYAMITGLSPSVTRAVVMITIAMTGRILGRHHSTINSLCFAAMLILIFDPRALFAPGFQLTMTAVAAICIIVNALPVIESGNRLIRVTLSWLYVSVAAIAGTSLLAAFYFHRLPLCALVANIPIAFILPPIIVLGFLLIVLETAGMHAPWLVDALDALTRVVRATSDSVSSLPGAVIDDLYIPWWGILAGYAAGLSLVYALYYRRRQALALGVALASVIPLSIAATRPPRYECFVATNSEFSAFVVADGSDIAAMTTSRPYHLAGAKTTLENQYHDFIARHGADSLWLVDTKQITFRGLSLAIAGNTIPAIADGCQSYILIGQEFSGKVEDLMRLPEATIFILGKDLNGRRRHFIEEELAAAGRRVVSAPSRLIPLRK